MAFYTVSLNDNGALNVQPVAGVTPPARAEDLARRFRNLLDTVRSRLPAGPGRTSYASELLAKAKIALEDENLDAGSEFLDQLDESLFDIKYFDGFVDDQGNVDIKPMRWAMPAPAEVMKFADRLERACAKVRLLISDRTRQLNHYATLSSYLRHGLRQGEIDFATTALAGFEAQFVLEEGPIIRKRHLWATVITALSALGLTAMLWLILHSRADLFAPSFLPTLPDQSSINTVALVAIGICLGIVFFAFIRNLTLTFDTLGNFDPAHLAPVLRFILVGVLATILCIVMWAGLLEVDINGLKLHEFMTSPQAAIVLGIVCGYSDAYITSLLTGILDRKPA